MSGKQLTFWEHLDELRVVLFRVIIVVITVSVAAFMLKEQLFAVVLAPKDGGFITYRLLGDLSSWFSSSGSSLEGFNVELINTELSRQFMVHIKIAMYAGFLVVFPYVLYEIFRFISPALYAHERRYAGRFIFSGYFMFLMGVALSYFLIFPLTFRFLASYQVSSEVQNLISLDSYISTMMMLNFMMGLVFELPILCWLAAKLGFLSSAFMRKYRRHAVVILLCISAVITPTADAMTLIMVALPMYILYELSILLVGITNKK
ncbi:MAG: twin-arginine translocase subunit TatC [Rikenellaceae bacterium]